MGINVLDQENGVLASQSRTGTGASAPTGTPTAAEAPTAAERIVTRSLEGRRAIVEEEIQRLVDAALALIRDQGHVEPRVTEIVQRAGLSNKAFYRHFRSKHELLVAVLDHGVEQLGAYLSRRMSRAEDPIAAIREWISGMLEQALNPEGAEATRPFVLAKGRLADGFPDEVAASERRLTEPLRAAIEAAVASGALPHANPDADAEAIYHLAMGWMQARLLEANGDAPPRARRLLALAMAGLLHADETEAG